MDRLESFLLSTAPGGALGCHLPGRKRWGWRHLSLCLKCPTTELRVGFATTELRVSFAITAVVQSILSAIIIPVSATLGAFNFAEDP